MTINCTKKSVTTSSSSDNINVLHEFAEDCSGAPSAAGRKAAPAVEVAVRFTQRVTTLNQPSASIITSSTRSCHEDAYAAAPEQHEPSTIAQAECKQHSKRVRSPGEPARRKARQRETRNHRTTRVSSQACIPPGLQDESVVTRKHAKFIVQLSPRPRTNEQGSECPMLQHSAGTLTHTDAQLSTGSHTGYSQNWTQDKSNCLKGISMVAAASD